MENKIVRDNLMNRDRYSPYYGNGHNCMNMPRTNFNGKQFYCRSCGWVSDFPDDFIKEYKERWGIE